MDAEGQAFAERIFPATAILQGNSALPKDQLFKRMTRQEFVEYIRTTTVSDDGCPHQVVDWYVSRLT
jgi:hypothetical protein